MSRGCVGSARQRSPGLSHGISLHVESWPWCSCRPGLNAAKGRAPVGEVGPVLFQISMEKDDGLWALWETAFFAVFQAPVGALFASMGAGRPQPPVAVPARVGSARTQRHGARCGPVPAQTRVTGLGRAERKRSGLSGRSSVVAKQRGAAVMSPGSRFESRAGAVCASSRPSARACRHCARAGREWRRRGSGRRQRHATCRRVAGWSRRSSARRGGPRAPQAGRGGSRRWRNARVVTRRVCATGRGCGTCGTGSWARRSAAGT